MAGGGARRRRPRRTGFGLGLPHGSPPPTSLPIMGYNESQWSQREVSVTNPTSSWTSHDLGLLSPVFNPILPFVSTISFSPSFRPLKDRSLPDKYPSPFRFLSKLGTKVTSLPILLDGTCQVCRRRFIATGGSEQFGCRSTRSNDCFLPESLARPSRTAKNQMSHCLDSRVSRLNFLRKRVHLALEPSIIDQLHTRRTGHRTADSDARVVDRLSPIGFGEAPSPELNGGAWGKEIPLPVRIFVFSRGLHSAMMGGLIGHYPSERPPLIPFTASATRMLRGQTIEEANYGLEQSH